MRVRRKVRTDVKCDRGIKLKHFVAAFRYLILRLGTIFFIAYVYSFKISLTYPLPSIIYSPFHVIRLSCLGSERPHGFHVLSHAPKIIAPLLIMP